MRRVASRPDDRIRSSNPRVSLSLFYTHTHDTSCNARESNRDDRRVAASRECRKRIIIIAETCFKARGIYPFS